MAKRLDDTETLFVEVLIATGSRSAAERAVGISSLTMTSRRHVEQALRDQLARRIATAAPMALHVLERLAQDENIPAAVRRLSASDILDRAGLVSHAALALAQPVESLSDMPAQSLRALVERLETELFARSTHVRALELQTADSSNGASVLD